MFLKDRGRKTVEDSLHGFATVLASFAALLAIVPIWEYSGWAYDLFYRTWQDTFLAEIGTMAYTALATSGVYYVCRAVMILAAMFIATRIYMVAA